MTYLIFLLAQPGGSEWFLVILGLGLYFLPTIFAFIREKSNAGAILALNLFLGWTLIGWVVSLVWALSAENKQMPTVIVNNTSQAHSQEYKAESVLENPQGQSELSRPKVISQQDKIDQLRQLKQLLDDGVLTNEEFNKQKASILG